MIKERDVRKRMYQQVWALQHGASSINYARLDYVYIAMEIRRSMPVAEGSAGRTQLGRIGENP